ncbi:tetratricopeptide repeat protein [Gammaproteobacteria bacterium]|jgi:tetratricopeptide (TPR) repeat protein|nr:tetratricopeptide repeat protein [Gammaproteobacteria bacterium]
MIFPRKQLLAEKARATETFRLATLAFFAVMASCTSLPEPDRTAQPESSLPELISEPASEAGPNQEYGAFTEEQLYRAIVGELEVNSGDIAAAGDSYLDLALGTKDLGVILRAVQFASIANDSNALLQLGMLWASVDPTDPQPQLLLAIEYLETGVFDRAIPRMARVLELGGSIDFSALSSRTSQLNPQSRAQLIQELEPLLTQFPDDDSLALAQVQLLAQSGEYDAALTALDTARSQVTQTAGTVLLETQILQNMGRADDAARVMRAGVKIFDTDPILRASLARLYISQEKFDDALEQYAILIAQDAENGEAVYAKALVYLEIEEYGEAESLFQHLIDSGERVDESRYYLATSFERQGQLERAIDNYRLVSIGTNNFLGAQQQATRLSIALGRVDAAHDWLQRVSRGQPRLEVLFINMEAQLLQQAGLPAKAKQLLDRSLNRYPGEVDLLFARVIYFDSIRDLASSEADLRSIIAIKPDDARALNHLGYMLADQTTRYEEALTLLENAIALNPGDPATTDSLAWAQYKLGRYEEALQNIRRAFAVFPDPEVASHMGEILWMMGRRDEALAVWRRALEDAPDDPLVTEAMQRLQNQVSKDKSE